MCSRLLESSTQVQKLLQVLQSVLVPKVAPGFTILFFVSDLLIEPVDHVGIVLLEKREVVFVFVPSRFADKYFDDKYLAESRKIFRPVSSLRNTACKINGSPDLHITSPANTNTSL